LGASELAPHRQSSRHPVIPSGRGVELIGAAVPRAANLAWRRERSAPKPRGLEQHPADPNALVGDDTSILESRMVEILVAVPDETGVGGLRQHLVSLFGRSCVSFDRARQEVRVRSELESRAVLQVIAAVQSWLAAGGAGSIRLSVGDRSFLIVDPDSQAAEEASAGLG
jgi:hypothetical protein